MLSKRAWATAGLPEVPEGGLAGHAKLEIDRTANTFVYSFTTGQNEKLALFQIRHNTAATSLLPITAAGLKHLLALANIILDGGETDA